MIIMARMLRPGKTEKQIGIMLNAGLYLQVQLRKSVKDGEQK